MLTLILLASTALSAEPTAAQTELLKTFHDEFIHITPGQGDFPASFVRGEEGKAATTGKVVFDHPFWIAKYEVPQNLWEVVMGKNPSRWKGPRNSVEMLTLAEAINFCNKATKLMRAADLIEADQEIRLPSESEWEYTVRAGTDTAYSFGDDVSQLDAYGWHTGNAAGNDPPVGAKKPNPWGLYDVHGYLWEWCSDDWAAGGKVPPGGGAVKSQGKSAQGVLRGGSWKDKAPLLTSRYRRAADKDLRDDAVGLRCVLATSK